MPQKPARTLLRRRALVVASQMHANAASSKTAIAQAHGNDNAVTLKRTAAVQCPATKEERKDVGHQCLAVTTSTVTYVVVASKRVAIFRTLFTMGITDITAIMDIMDTMDTTYSCRG